MAKEKTRKPALGKKARKSEELLLRLKSLNAFERAEVARKLGELGMPSLVEPLSKLFTDQAWNVKLEALKAVSKINSDAARSQVIRCLDDPNVRIKTEAIQIAGRLRLRQAVPSLTRILQTETVPFVKCSAAQALGEINDSGSIRHLASVMKAPGHVLKSCASLALRRMDRAAVKRELEPLLKSKDCHLRREAADILRALS